MLRKILLLSLVAAVLGPILGGCGRRGPLEAPPGAPPEPARFAEDKAVERANGGRPAIMPTTDWKQQEEDYVFSRDKMAIPAKDVIGKSQPFFLDPILSDK